MATLITFQDFVECIFVIVESNTTMYDRQLVPVMNDIAEAYENAENSYTCR